MCAEAAGALAFHPEGLGRGQVVGQDRSEKEARMREGRAHAALIHAGTDCVGWCHFDPTDELPRIKRRRVYAAGLAALPDWRITCFFVGKRHREQGSRRRRLRAPLRRSPAWVAGPSRAVSMFESQASPGGVSWASTTGW